MAAKPRLFAAHMLVCMCSCCSAPLIIISAPTGVVVGSVEVLLDDFLSYSHKA